MKNSKLMEFLYNTMYKTIVNALFCSNSQGHILILEDLRAYFQKSVSTKGNALFSCSLCAPNS